MSGNRDSQACGAYRSARPGSRKDGVVVERQTGFPFGTHAAWLAFHQRRNNAFDATQFTHHYSESDFVRYQKAIAYQKITYLSDGLKVKGVIVKPRRTGGKKLPVLIYNRGGNRDYGRLVFGMLYRFFEWIADGYILVASQYRGNAGGDGTEEYGGADVNDVLNLLPVIESIPEADASRIGMYGRSRGAMMTCLALTRTDRIRAAILEAGLVDVFDTIARRPEMEAVFADLIPRYDVDKDAGLSARSPVRWPEKLCKSTPLLLFHGSADGRVHPSQALKMASALHESRHPFRFVMFEGGDHKLSRHRGEVNRIAKQWLDRYVRDGKSLPQPVSSARKETIGPHGPCLHRGIAHQPRHGEAPKSFKLHHSYGC